MQQLLTYCLLLILSGNIYSCKSENKNDTNKQQQNDKEMETKYQAIWEKALTERDLTTIDSLIGKNRRFKLSGSSTRIDIYMDTLSNPLECAFYWSLIENTKQWELISDYQYNLKRIQSTIDYLEDRKDYLHSYSGLGTGGLLELIEWKNNKEIKEFQLKNLKIERDSILNKIADCRKTGESNLSIIQYCLNKGMKFKDYSSIKSLVFGSDYLESPINEVSIIYYFENIAGNKNFYEPEIELPNLTFSFALYSTYDFANTKLIKRLYSLGINKTQFYELLYPHNNEDSDYDYFYPKYQAEKTLFELMPEEMVQHSGHTLLHTAIINLDVQAIKDIIQNNKNELYKKTMPINEFLFKYYGKTALSPLELAHYTQKVNEEKIKQHPDDLIYKLRLQQIKEIIAFLQQETGTTAMNSESPQPDRPSNRWTTLIED